MSGAVAAALAGAPWLAVGLATADAGDGAGWREPARSGGDYRDRVADALGAYARRLGRPVKWTETRSENVAAMPQGRGQIQYAKLGGSRDGRITAYQLDVFQDAGAYPIIGAILAPVAQDLQVSVAAAGQAMTAYAVATALLSPLLLVLTGSWPRRRAIAPGVVH